MLLPKVFETAVEGPKLDLIFCLISANFEEVVRPLSPRPLGRTRSEPVGATSPSVVTIGTPEFGETSCKTGCKIFSCVGVSVSADAAQIMSCNRTIRRPSISASAI